ncbi:MAG: DUF2993 domain-containing protein [Cyanobacteria bacterium J06554_6]
MWNDRKQRNRRLARAEKAVTKVEQGSRILGRVLPAAVRLWLRSQLDQIENLTLNLQGSDRQVLSGCIPGVSLAAEQSVYKGIHLSKVNVAAEDISINLGQVLRGKPLRLVKAFPVRGAVEISEDGLNASLAATLLSEGIERFWQSLLQRPEVAAEVEDYYGTAALQSHAPLTQARLTAPFLTLINGDKQLRAGLTVKQGRHLVLNQPTWLVSAQDRPSHALKGFAWDLGSEAQIHQLTIVSKRLLCAGQIEVRP